MNRGVPPHQGSSFQRPGNSNQNRAPAPPQKVDREKTCPFLLRAFVHPNSHHNVSDFTPTSTPSRDEHQLYIWRDTTLAEILILLRDASPQLRAPGAMRYSVRIVFYDTQRDCYSSRDLGLLSARELLPSEFSQDSSDRPSNYRKDRTLEECRFVVGDYLDVSFIAGGAGMSFGGGQSAFGVPASAGPEAVGGAAGLGKLLMGIKGNAGRQQRGGGPGDRNGNANSNSGGWNPPPHLNNSRANDRADLPGPPRVTIPVGGGYAAKLAAAGNDPSRMPPRNAGGAGPSGGGHGGRNNDRVSDNAGGGAAGGWGRRNGPLAAQGGDLESRDNGRDYGRGDGRGPPMRDFGGRDRDLRDSRPELPRRRRNSRSVSPGRFDNSRGRAASKSPSRFSSRSRSPPRGKSPARNQGGNDKEGPVDAGGDAVMK